MKNNFKVSVIIPVYNSEKYIEKCLDSVLNQTYKNFEIIVINDGSKDNSKEILERYEKEYPNIIRHIEQENRGVAKTRNYGIQIAEGDYIAFIDNDDYIDNDYLENFVNAAKTGDYDAIIGGYRRPNEDGKIIKEVHLQDEEWSKFIVFAPWAKIYRKEYILKNDIKFLSNNIGEDIYFNIQALLISEKIKIINYVGYNWFYNTKSVSNTTHKNLKKLNVFYLLDSCYEAIKAKGILQNKYQLLEMYFIRYIIWYLMYTTKKAKYKDISEEYDKLFNWLEERFPNYKKNTLVRITKPKGESLLIRTFISFFMLMHKLKLGKLLVAIYSKI
ncbi:MAG: glycosyltransferase [Clostridia bacterium]